MSVVGLIGNKRNWKLYVFCISLFFANAAYCYNPESTSPDLYRYFQYVSSLRNSGLIETLTNGYGGAKLYSFNFMVWITNACNDEHLLPAMSVFLVYLIALYCTCYTGVRENAKWKYVVLVAILQMMTLDWYSLTNNVRNILAFAIIGLAIYRDIYLNNRNVFTLFCYIFPLFLHPTALLFIVIRIALIFTKKRIIKTFMIIATLLINPIVDFLNSSMFRVTSNPYVLLVINKAYNYLFDTSTAYGLAVRASLRSTVTRVFYLSIMVAIVLFFFEKISVEKKSNRRILTDSGEYFTNYVLITCLLALACTFMLRPEYWRFSATAIVFISIMLLPLLEYSESYTVCRITKYFILFLTLGCFLLWMYQLTWLNTYELISNTLITSPAITIARALISFCGGI